MAAEEQRTAAESGTEGRQDPRARNRGPAARRRPKRTSRAIIVGAFVLMAGLLFVLALFMIGDRRSLFQRDFELYTEFPTLGGIQNGAIVRVAGADAGEVEEIRVPRNPSEKFRLKMRVLESLRGLVRTDSVASIMTDGLVGNKYIQIEAGTDAAPQAPDGSTIAGSALYDFTDLFAQASKTLGSVNTLVEEVRTAVQTTLRGVTETTRDINVIMQGLNKEMQVILHRTDGVIVELGTIVKDIRAGRGSAGKLIYDTELYDRANGLLKQADGVIAKVNEAADQAKLLVTDMRSNTGPMQGAIADLRRTLAGAGEAMSDLSENTEALKRNFFFKGFFERRGYYDLDDVPVAEYRKGALEGADRRVVRVWLKAEVLFGKDEQGQEVLTEDGKARLESAISELLSLPKDSPIVIEGYAAAPTYDARYIDSRGRASLARDHLVTRFQLDRARIGVMPMGSEAPGSPANGTWDGVAIAIFLKTAR